MLLTEAWLTPMPGEVKGQVGNSVLLNKLITSNCLKISMFIPMEKKRKKKKVLLLTLIREVSALNNNESGDSQPANMLRKSDG